MIKKILLAVFFPVLAFGASDIKIEKQELLFEKGVAYTRRDESSASTINALSTSTTYVKLASVVTAINGMAAPAASASAKLILVSNRTGGAVTIRHESASASAANRFDLPGDIDITLADKASASFIYDYPSTRWVIAGGSGSGSGTAEGVSKRITQSSHGFSVGEVLYFDGADFALAQADDEATSEVLGVVSEVVDTNTFVLTPVGYISGLTGLTAGTTYYLSEATPGALTDTEPDGTGEVSKPVLVADSTTSGYVIQSRGYIINSGGGGGSGFENGTQTFTSTGDNSFVVPAGIERLFAEGCGGGTAGAFPVSTGTGGRGGTAAYVYKGVAIPVTPGETLNVRVAAAAAGGTATAPSTAADSYIEDSNPTRLATFYGANFLTAAGTGRDSMQAMGGAPGTGLQLGQNGTNSIYADGGDNGSSAGSQGGGGGGGAGRLPGGTGQDGVTVVANDMDAPANSCAGGGGAYGDQGTVSGDGGSGWVRLSW